MLHLAMKAFYPAKPPFPLLHVDTTWKFREMIAFRDQMANELGLKLSGAHQSGGSGAGHQSVHARLRIHTDIMKTEGLKQALDTYGFDAAFGGARRDEEKSRAKERIFSFRSAQHRWDPKRQRPELWRSLQRPQEQGREHPRFPVSQLDRAGHLAIHPSGEHPDRASVFRGGAPRGGARRHADHGG